MRAGRRAGWSSGVLWLLAVWVLGLGLDSALAEPASSASSKTPGITAATGGADDVTRTVLIGASGQIYEPGETPGTWQRRVGGGVSVAVTGAVAIPDHGLFAGGARAPLFRFDTHAWHVHPLANRGSCRIATTGAPAMAIGRHVYTWRNQRWVRLGSAPGRVTALWAATASRAYAATAGGQLLQARAGGFRRIQHPLAPDDPIELITGRPGKRAYAVAQSGAVLRLGTGRATLVSRAPELSALKPQVAAVAPDGTLWIAGISPAGDGEPTRTVLVHTDHGVLGGIEALPALKPQERLTLLRIDARGGMLVTTSAGALRYRTAGADLWREGALLGELPMPVSSIPGRGPAHSR